MWAQGAHEHQENTSGLKETESFEMMKSVIPTDSFELPPTLQLWQFQSFPHPWLDPSYQNRLHARSFYFAHLIASLCALHSLGRLLMQEMPERT